MTYRLQIVTPDGQRFDGQAEKAILRTTQGEVCIMARHIDYVAPLGMGRARVTVDGESRDAACIGGVVLVSDGTARIIATSFEWKDEIDIPRAKEAYRKAKETLAQDLSPEDQAIQQARMKRAMVRLSVVGEAVE